MKSRFGKWDLDELAVDSTPLLHPPITETVLGAVFQLENANDELLRRWIRALSSEWVEEPSKVGGLRFKMGENQILLVGGLVDGRHVSFSYCLLPPYTSWEKFISLAVSCFKSFASIAGVRVVKRIANRTRDVLVVPESARERDVALKDVVKTIPPDVQGLSLGTYCGFQFKDTIYYPAYDLQATTVRELGVARSNSLPPVVLDTDVFSIRPFDAKDAEYLQDVLARIHYLRNKIFSGSVGDAYMEYCKNGKF